MSPRRQTIAACLLLCALELGACSGGHGSATPPPTPTPTPTPVTTPTAAFTAPATTSANVPVAFDASASASTDGSALEYFWDFGNGRYGGGVQIAQLFPTGGAQPVTLTVIDGSGRKATRTKTVTVSAPPVASGTVSVQGAITALDGTALAGVTVAVVGGAATATADSMGHASLMLDVGVPVTLKLSKSGYSDQFVALEIPATAGADAYFEATMRLRDVALTLADAAAGGTVTGRDGAVFTLPANALVDATGAAVTGAVQISITPVDVTQPAAAGFPGSFRGVTTTGTTQPIVSYGTVEYVLGTSGTPLRLAPGKTATIEIPAYATLNADGTAVVAGDTTPLWSLDEATGEWVQEGTGTFVASNTSPTELALRATVTHFSWWNADIGFDPYDPSPKCEDATNIGIPGGTDHLANASICNMLAQFDNNLPIAAAADRVHAQAATLSPRITGYAERYVLPIGGGVPIQVPPGVNIRLSASALNGTWLGQLVVNGAQRATGQVVIPMNPIGGTGPTAEPITAPLDTTRSLQTGQTALYSFTATQFQYAQITIGEANASTLAGQLRLLQGATVLGTTTFGAMPGTLTVRLPVAGTYTIEVTGTANTPGAYRLQLIGIFGGIQSAALQLPFDTTGTLAQFTTYEDMFTTAAPSTAFFAFQRQTNGASLSFSVIAPDGSVPLAFATGATATQVGTASLATAGSYVAELGTADGSSASYRLTAQPTHWLAVGLPLATDSVFSVVDLVADRNGAPVVGWTVNANTPSGQPPASVLKLRRWNGSAWETVGTDLTVTNSCANSGQRATAFAFDANNAPVVAYGSNTGTGGSIVTAQRFTGGAWQPLGPNAGTLPNQSNVGGACSYSLPAIAFGSDGAPLLAYIVDTSIYVQRFDGTAWGAVTTAPTDTFPTQGGSVALGADANGVIWFVTANSYPSNQPTSVRRLKTTTIPATWETLGSLPQSGSLVGYAAPQLRFDGANQPVISFKASVSGPGGVGNGVAVYRYDGAQFTSSGGYEADANSYISNGDVYMALFGGEIFVSWTNSEAITFTNAPIVQKYTGAGYIPYGPGRGEIPQYSPQGLTTQTGYSPHLAVAGGALYMAIATNSGAGAPSQTPQIQMLRRVD